MKTIIFDLKNTLLDEQGEWLKGAREALSLSSGATRRILYTMNEQWTYTQIARYPQVWQQFDQLLLTAKKQCQDLESLARDDVLVVGDSVTEEIQFAQELDYQYITVQGEIPLRRIEMFLAETKR